MTHFFMFKKVLVVQLRLEIKESASNITQEIVTLTERVNNSLEVLFSQNVQPTFKRRYVSTGKCSFMEKHMFRYSCVFVVTQRNCY